MASTMENVPDEMPTYVSAFKDIYKGTQGLARKDDYGMGWFQGFLYDLSRFSVVSKQDWLLIFGLAFNWTLVRYATSILIFTPLSQSLRLSKVNVAKFPESAWKLLIYSSLWYLSCSTLFSAEHDNIFYKPLGIWQDWAPGMAMSTSIYAVYMLQLSFYMHSVYGTLFMDQWRKDSAVMLFHHFLTLSLVGFSYAMRYHKIGLLVLWIHDISDICLEFTKLNVYMKDRKDRFYKLHDAISVLGFLAFASCWYVFRLYWYPLKVLHSTAWGTYRYDSPAHTQIPCWCFFNVMLWILLGLNVYWFAFILVFLYRVLTGQVKEVDDIREDDVAEKLQQKRQRELRAKKAH